MKITIVTFGTIKNPQLKELEGYYKLLISKTFKIEYIELKDVTGRKLSLSDIPDIKGKYLFLSEDGKEFSTNQFAEQIKSWMNQSQDVNFIIANAFGFDDKIKSTQSLFSLSQMTFPHEFAKVLLLEQLFRVGDILKGGKYHK